jgi:hypothetical protein
MPWQKLTPAGKKKITADWSAEFPGFGVYKPLYLLRRAGPLLMGIRLQPGSGNEMYRPLFHVHNLARASPNITLSHMRRVANEYVHMEWHESKYPKMVEAIKRLTYLPLSGPVTLAQVLAGLRSYQERPSVPYDPFVFSDMALACGWAGDRAQMEIVLAEAANTMKPWPAAALDPDGGLSQWLVTVRAAAENRQQLQATVAEQIALLKVDKVPIADFTLDR